MLKKNKWKKNHNYSKVKLRRFSEAVLLWNKSRSLRNINWLVDVPQHLKRSVVQIVSAAFQHVISTHHLEQSSEISQRLHYKRQPLWLSWWRDLNLSRVWQWGAGTQGSSILYFTGLLLSKAKDSSWYRSTYWLLDPCFLQPGVLRFPLS